MRWCLPLEASNLLKISDGESIRSPAVLREKVSEVVDDVEAVDGLQEVEQGLDLRLARFLAPGKDRQF